MPKKRHFECNFFTKSREITLPLLNESTSEMPGTGNNWYCPSFLSVKFHGPYLIILYFCSYVINRIFEGTDRWTCHICWLKGYFFYNYFPLFKYRAVVPYFIIIIDWNLLFSLVLPTVKVAFKSNFVAWKDGWTRVNLNAPSKKGHLNKTGSVIVSYTTDR